MMAEPLVQVKINQKQLDAATQAVRDVAGGIGIVVSRGINRTMSSGAVRIAREVAANTKIGVRMARSKIYLKRATRAKWNGFLGLSESDFDLTKYFDAEYTRGEGVSVKVLRDRRTFLPRAFIPTRFAAVGLGWAKGRKWWGGGRVLMRAPQSGETPRWDNPSYGRLAPRFPVMRVRGPSLADLWEKTPEMVNNAVSYSQHAIEKNIHDQVVVLLKQAGFSGEGITERLQSAGME